MAAGKYRAYLKKNEESGLTIAETIFGKVKDNKAGNIDHTMKNISFFSTYWELTKCSAFTHIKSFTLHNKQEGDMIVSILQKFKQNLKDTRQLASGYPHSKG